MEKTQTKRNVKLTLLPALPTCDNGWIHSAGHNTQFYIIAYITFLLLLKICL